MLPQLHPHPAEIRRQPQLQLPGQPHAPPRPRLHRLGEHNPELRRAEEAQLRLHQEPPHPAADPRARPEHPRQQQDPAHPPVLHGHDPERAGLPGHPLRARSDAHADPVRRQPGLEPQHVRGDQAPPASVFPVDLQDEELHLVLLRHARLAEGEPHHGPGAELLEDHNSVLLGHEAQTFV